MDETVEQRRGALPAAFVATVALTASLAAVFFLIRQRGLDPDSIDPYSYGKIARGFLEHGFDKLTRHAAMLYPHLLAVIYWLGGTDFVAILINCLFHVGTCLSVFALGRRLFNARTGLIAGIACALHPMLLRYVPDLHTEALLALLSTLTVWCAVLFDERPTVGRGILLGTVGMISTLAKGVMLPFLLIFGGLAILRSRRSAPGVPGSLRGALAMFAAIAVVLAPWTYRNYRVTGGSFVLLTPGAADAFLRGYVFTRLEFATLKKPPYTDAENEVNAWFRSIARESGTVWGEDEVVDEKNNQRVAKRMILEHPFDTGRKVMVGAFTFWYEMTSLQNSLVPGVLALVSWILAFFGLRRARDEGRRAWLLWLPIVVMNLLVAALIPLGRYSVPVLPCLTLLAAFGAEMFLAPRQANQRSLARQLPPGAAVGNRS